MYHPTLYFPSPSPSAALNPSNLSAFRFPNMRNVFLRSTSLISAQFAMRLSVPSRLTTMGPRWSRAMAWPVETSRVGVELEEGEEGEGRGRGCEEGDCVVEGCASEVGG